AEILAAVGALIGFSAALDAADSAAPGDGPDQRHGQQADQGDDDVFAVEHSPVGVAHFGLAAQAAAAGVTFRTQRAPLKAISFAVWLRRLSYSTSCSPI